MYFKYSEVFTTGFITSRIIFQSEYGQELWCNQSIQSQANRVPDELLGPKRSGLRALIFSVKS